MSKFPVALAGHCLQNKVDLFNEWLQAGGDWSKVELNYQRKVTSSREFKKGRKGMKPRQILATYGEENLGEVKTKESLCIHICCFVWASRFKINS